MVLVRTAQEALTNAQKHASATVIALSLSVEAGAYLLTCADDGRGPSGEPSPAVQSHFGLDNLRARAGELGGTIDLGGSDSGGAVLRLRLPTNGARRNG
jgi:signal transduction histidine kinase